jgi:surfactin synthase thioesterase subunit
MEAAFRVVFGMPSQGRPNLLNDFVADLALWHAMPIPALAPLDIPIAAFRGTDDHIVSEANKRRWIHRTTRGFSLTTLPGPHAYLSQERPRGLLLKALATRLAAQSPDESGRPEDVPAAHA